MNNEDIIIYHLINDDEYFSRVYPCIKSDFFQDSTPRRLFSIFKKIIEERDARPTYDGLEMVINNDTKIDPKDKEDLKKYINDKKDKTHIIDINILIPETEKWAKINSFRNAVSQAIDIVKSSNKDSNIEKAMAIMEDGFNVDFANDSFSMSFNDEADRRRRFLMLQDENIIRSGFKPLDDLVGGFKRKTLNVFQAPTNQGKTLTMTFLASQFIMQGYDVAYATLEVAAEEILARVDANLLDTSTFDLSHLKGGDEMFIKLFKKVDDKNPGRLEVRQFAGASWVNIKIWMKELAIKKKFRPQILFIDYLGLMKSTTIEKSDNLYSKMKACAEEIRENLSIAMELTVFSAAQTKRDVESRIREQGEKTIVGNDDVGESYGLPQTVDTFISQFEISQGIDKYINNDISSTYIWLSTKTRSFVPPGRRVQVGVSKCKQRLVEINIGNIDEKIINKIDETVDYLEKQDDFFGDWNGIAN